MNFQKFGCSACGCQFWASGDHYQPHCVNCGKIGLNLFGKKFTLPFVDTIEYQPARSNNNDKMTLREFSEKINSYEEDLAPCPFCKHKDYVIIHQMDVPVEDLDEEDVDAGLKEFVIECEDCGCILKSEDSFQEHDDDYEKLNKYIQNLCQKWDLRGENIEGTEE